jgi:hypothetical protein
MHDCRARGGTLDRNGTYSRSPEKPAQVRGSQLRCTKKSIACIHFLSVVFMTQGFTPYSAVPPFQGLAKELLPRLPDISGSQRQEQIACAKLVLQNLLYGR